MLPIHHSQIKKAEKMGVILTAHIDGVEAFWAQRNLRIYGVSAAEAITQMQAAQKLGEHPDVKFHHHPENERLITVEIDGKFLKSDFDTPQSLWTKFEEGGEYANPAPGGLPNFGDELLKDPNVERLNGVPIDGGVAFKEGVPSADCPYSSEEGEDGENSEEYDNFLRWNEEWDNAADEKAAEDDENKEGGSVVKQKFRLRYAELGHPTHCGDWLAELLNNMVLTKKGTDIARFEAICDLNGVSLAKYKHEGKGWEGRLRMTGRNLLAKVVFANGGVVKIPGVDGQPDEEYKAPGEWMQAQRFKTKGSSTNTQTNDADVREGAPE